jgi:hypothetical protein
MKLDKYNLYFNLNLIIITIMLCLIASYSIAKSNEIVSSRWGKPKYSNGVFIYPKENLPEGTPHTVRKEEAFRKHFSLPIKINRISLFLSFGPPDYGLILKPDMSMDLKDKTIPLPDGAWEGWIYKLDDNINQVYIEIAGNELISVVIENQTHAKSSGELIWSIAQQSKDIKRK